MKPIQTMVAAVAVCASFPHVPAANSPAGEPRRDEAAAHAPQPQSTLERILAITWKKGPNLPQGFQDSDGGILGDTLISVAGFCGGNKTTPGKPDTYPRGFLKKVFGLDLSAPGATWRSLPEFPGTARQELSCIVVDEKLYCWAGFSYSAPFTYQDGYRLSRTADGWEFDRLPDLPSPVCSAGIAAVGSKIYIVGGGDYDEKHFYTRSDRSGGNKNLGSRLLVLDTRCLDQGWKRLPDCPGSTRMVHAAAAVGGRIYVIGGATMEVRGAHTVVDNWVYDPVGKRWDRIRDLPVASGNFPAGAIVYKGRYILLLGGFAYSDVGNPDGTTRPTYGKPYKHYRKDDPNQTPLHRYFGDYYSDVFVYDTKTALFGKADPLPLNNNLPMMVVRGNQIYLIGGETGGSIIEGERYGHHPELFLIGTITEGR
jgi:N-acetylneuraminic acid mutarotase